MALGKDVVSTIVPWVDGALIGLVGVASACSS